MSGVKPRDDLAVLMGKRLVVASEFNENDELDEFLLKQLSGEEERTYRHLYGKYMNYTPEFLVYTGTNHICQNVERHQAIRCTTSTTCR